MDNLTHSLFALTLANVGLRRAGRGATAALLIASNLPDIEVVMTFGGGRAAYLDAHRGPTHGPGGLLLAAGVAAGVWGWQQLRARRHRGAGTGGAEDSRPDASFLALLGVSVVGVLGHIAMDFATSYGTRVLSPFTAAWFGVDWMPIVEVFLLAALLIAVILPRWRPAWRVRLAAAALACAAVDYAGHAALHAAAISRGLELQQALSGTRGTIVMPPTIFHYLGTDARAALPAALPTLGSPFRWRLVAHAAGGYVVTEVNLLEDRTWLDSARRAAVWFPNDTGPLVERAAGARLGRLFLSFSRFPSAEIVPHANGDLTVHWYDLRFAARRTPVGNDRRQHTSPFGAWVRLSPSGHILGQGLGPG